MSNFQQELIKVVKKYRSNLKELLSDKHPSATIAHAQILDEAVEAITKLTGEQVIGEDEDFYLDVAPYLPAEAVRNNFRDEQRTKLIQLFNVREDK